MFIIFIIDSLANNIPISNINNDITKPDTYSYLAYPYGCTLLAFLHDNLKPIIVNIDVNESDKLLKASAIILTLLLIKPIISFISPKIRLEIIPKVPAKAPYLFLNSVFSFFIFLL